MLAYLSHNDLASMSRVSQEWASLVLDEHLWQVVFARRFAHRWDQPALVVPPRARQAYRTSLAAFRRYSPIAKDTLARLIDALENTKAWTLISVPPQRIDDLHPEVNVYEHFIPNKEVLTSPVSIIYHTRCLVPIPLEDLTTLLLGTLVCTVAMNPPLGCDLHLVVKMFCLFNFSSHIVADLLFRRNEQACLGH